MRACVCRGERERAREEGGGERDAGEREGESGGGGGGGGRTAGHLADGWLGRREVAPPAASDPARHRSDTTIDCKSRNCFELQTYKNKSANPNKFALRVQAALHQLSLACVRACVYVCARPRTKRFVATVFIICTTQSQPPPPPKKQEGNINK